MEFTQEEKTILLQALEALNQRGQSLQGSQAVLALAQKISQSDEY